MGARLKIKIKRRRYWLPLLVVIVVLVVIIGGKSLNKPAVGIVQQAPISPTPTAQSVHDVQASGKYISFNYPSNFAAIKTDPPAGTQLEVFSYLKRPSPFWFLNAQVSTLASGNLADDGSYNMRKLNPSRFKVEHWQINGSTVEVFADQSEGYSKAAFMARGGKLLSVSANGGTASDSDKLDAAMKQILTSVKWL